MRREFYFTNHPDWKPPPHTAIPVEGPTFAAHLEAEAIPVVEVEIAEGQNIQLTTTVAAEQIMDHSWDVKKAAEEDTKRRRSEAARKTAADRNATAKEAEKKKAKEAKRLGPAKEEAENAAKRKAEEAKKIEAGRKIKQENIEKIKKGVFIKEPLPTSKKPSRDDEAEQQGREVKNCSFRRDCGDRGLISRRGAAGQTKRNQS